MLISSMVMSFVLIAHLTRDRGKPDGYYHKAAKASRRNAILPAGIQQKF
jgi:hypothetical protein